MGSTHTAKCKWCGTQYQKGNNALVFIKLGSDFCSKRCESAYNTAHDGDDSSSNSGEKESRLSKEEKKQIKLENEQREYELNKLQEEEKIKNKELADKTMKFFKVVKPYLKFIVPAYIIAFCITFFFVEKESRFITGVFFGLPLIYVGYLTYNAIANKSK